MQKKNITIVTFITSYEKENVNFLSVVESLKDVFCVEYFIFSDSETIRNGAKVNFTVDSKSKFKRIDAVLSLAKNDFILCIDNDIVVNNFELKGFLNSIFKNDFSLAWGKISCQSSKGFVPRLIEIDKKLSHNILRPGLWKLGLGISIPGQIFCINRVFFHDKLSRYDTVFDDLTLGLICKQYSMPVFISKTILGFERPKGTFFELIKQRIRWAKGFSETLKYSEKTGFKKFVLIHGFAYHQLWILFYLLIVFLCILKLYYSIFIILAILMLFLSNFKWKLFLYSLCYIVVFPLIHIIWNIVVGYEIVSNKIIR